MKLVKPKVVLDATAEYINGEDKIGRFIAECCEVAPELEQRSGKVFDAFKRWCAETNLYAGRANEFMRALEQRGFKRNIRAAGASFVVGLRLNEEYGGL